MGLTFVPRKEIGVYAASWNFGISSGRWLIDYLANRNRHRSFLRGRARGEKENGSKRFISYFSFLSFDSIAFS